MKNKLDLDLLNKAIGCTLNNQYAQAKHYLKKFLGQEEDKSIRVMTKNDKNYARILLVRSQIELFEMEGFEILYNVLRYDPNSSMIHEFLSELMSVEGSLYFQKQEKDGPETIKFFLEAEKYLDRFNDFASNVINGSIACRLRQSEEMFKYLQMARKLMPGNQFLLCHFGTYFMLTCNFEKALECFKFFIRKNPSIYMKTFDIQTFTCRYIYSLYLWRENKVTEAKHLMDESIDLYERFCETKKPFVSFPKAGPSSFLGNIATEMRVLRHILYLDSYLQEIFEANSFSEIIKILNVSHSVAVQSEKINTDLGLTPRDFLFPQILSLRKQKIISFLEIVAAMTFNFAEIEKQAKKIEETKKALIDMGFIQGKQAFDAIENFVLYLKNASLQYKRLEDIPKREEAKILESLKPAYIRNREESRSATQKILSEFEENKKVKTGKFEPEYENILEIIQNMALVIERSPSAFKNMKEEDLRQHFLVQLNGQYEGQATGETFNYQGKTDILIRWKGKNVFIAECKFWRGEKKFLVTIDQLLNYVSWRDTKTAILLFYKDRDLSRIQSMIPQVVKKHACYKREADIGPNIHTTQFRYIFRQPGDPKRELVLTVMIFNVPS
ncbi:MAG: hypothetical protein V2A65_02955 [Candidatus Omnitrophota bacterium]